MASGHRGSEIAPAQPNKSILDSSARVISVLEASQGPCQPSSVVGSAHVSSPSPSSVPIETETEKATSIGTWDEGERSQTQDWLDLPMLMKLDSLHQLIEWQFHNPSRLRAIMKDDDESAQWVSLPPATFIVL